MPRDADPRATARLVTAAQLCAYLGGIGTSTLHRWIDDGIIPGPIKSTRRWDLRAVDAALNQHSPLLTVANDLGDDPIEQNRKDLERRFGHGGDQG